MLCSFFFFLFYIIIHQLLPFFLAHRLEYERGIEWLAFLGLIPLFYFIF